jgi:hypothetical protein
LLISDESPLRRLPSQLNRHQIFFLDGIRYCLEIIDLLNVRLKSILSQITDSFIKKESKPDHQNFVSAFQDAWSFIDSVYRLRGLLSHCPGIKQKASGIVLFYKETNVVENFRHIFQHLNTEMNKLIQEDLPVFGVISWLSVFDPTQKSCYSCTLIAGTLIQRTSHHIINPVGKAIYPPVDYITLTAGGFIINLSSMFQEIMKLTRSFEEQLRDQFKEISPAGADLAICLKITSGDEVKEGQF